MASFTDQYISQPCQITPNPPSHVPFTLLYCLPVALYPSAPYVGMPERSLSSNNHVLAVGGGAALPRPGGSSFAGRPGGRGRSQNGGHQRQLTLLEINVFLLLLPCGLSRSESTLHYRLWLGVAFTKAYSFLIGMASNTGCDACGPEETIEHVLCRCPQYSSKRSVLATKLSRLGNRPFTVDAILGYRSLPSTTQKATKAILRFLNNTC